MEIENPGDQLVKPPNQGSTPNENWKFHDLLTNSDRRRLKNGNRQFR
jgi:hypothetical protein